MRLVLDTNIVVSAFLWAGAPWRLLQATHQGRAELFTSALLLRELEETLAKSRFASKLTAAGLSARELVARYAEFTTPVAPIVVTGVATHPEDDIVIGTALAAGAEAIVTGDGPLLAIQRYRSIGIVSVHTALEMIEVS